MNTHEMVKEMIGFSDPVHHAADLVEILYVIYKQNEKILAKIEGKEWSE